MMDYTVTVEVSVTAESPEEAAKFALDDLQDPNIEAWSMEVSCSRGKQMVTVRNDRDDDETDAEVESDATPGSH